MNNQTNQVSIENLKVSTNPARLRWSDTSTKSKILLDVCWHWIKGNKCPYLSVEVLQVKKDGVSIRDYQEQKRAIKVLNKEFRILLDCHLVGFNDALGGHEILNAQYHFKQLRLNLYTQPKTKEQLMTIDKFCEYYSMNLETVKTLSILPTDEANQKILELLESKALQNKTELLRLTEALNIPLIKND